jgi:hypothetical protein
MEIVYEGPRVDVTEDSAMYEVKVRGEWSCGASGDPEKCAGRVTELRMHVQPNVVFHMVVVVAAALNGSGVYEQVVMLCCRSGTGWS